MRAVSPCRWNIEMPYPGVVIHATAIVDEGARIGAGTKIWHWVHISSGAVIGETVPSARMSSLATGW